MQPAAGRGRSCASSPGSLLKSLRHAFQYLRQRHEVSAGLPHPISASSLTGSSSASHAQAHNELKGVYSGAGRVTGGGRR